MTTPDRPQLTLLGTSYAALADALAGLDDATWAKPSMCDGWAVANVVAHLTMVARYGEPGLHRRVVSGRVRLPGNVRSDRSA